MTSAMLIAATLATLLLGDAFELVRVSPVGSYKVAYSLVRILGANCDTLVEARTDRYGRIKLDLPKGTYAAEVIDGKRTYRFKITFSGGNKLTRIELK